MTYTLEHDEWTYRPTPEFIALLPKFLAEGTIVLWDYAGIKQQIPLSILRALADELDTRDAVERLPRAQPKKLFGVIRWEQTTPGLRGRGA